MNNSLSAALLKVVSKESQTKDSKKSSTVKVGTVVIVATPVNLGEITV